MSFPGKDSESGPRTPGSIIFIKLSEALRDHIQSQARRRHDHHHEEGDLDDEHGDDGHEDGESLDDE
ncbi:MAG: hypothetical protein LBB77_07605, partial [Treponema sp.]|nr:hypothetical protein [Treponema sp.]